MASGGEGSSRSRTARILPPDVVVLTTDYRQEMRNQQASVSKRQDLWLSSADGRYSSVLVPIRVGPTHSVQTFHVHRDILVKSMWFCQALCGKFREAKQQAIDLPEEDPAVFHFLVAFLYENRFEPLRPAADPARDKGKGVAVNVEPTGSNTSSNISATTSTLNLVRSQAETYNSMRRATNAGGPAGRAGKPPFVHRGTCRCDQCLETEPERYQQWRAQQLGMMPYPPGQSPWGPHHGHNQPAPSDQPVPNIEERDMPTWLMTYELHIDVYICAVRYLMDDFCKAIIGSTVDMLEAAGTDAAHPTVLRLCRKLYTSVPETDPLLRMILARVGFLQPTLWNRAPHETYDLLVDNPELAALMLKETALTHHATTIMDLPPMMIDSRTPPVIPPGRLLGSDFDNLMQYV